MFTKIIFPTANFHFLADSSEPVTLGTIGHGGITRANDRPWIALSLVLCAHLAAFAALSQQQQSLPLEATTQPIMVSLMSAPQATPQKPAPITKPVVKEQKPVKKQVKTPTRKPAVPLVKQATQPVEQSSTPVAAPSSPVAEQQSKATNSKPVLSAAKGATDTQTYQAPDFNAAYLNNPSPAYPPVSRRLGEEGLVMLRVQVTQDGKAGSVELESSSGSNRLDQAALEAVKKWQFVPAKRGEQSISASVVVPVRFSIEG